MDVLTRTQWGATAPLGRAMRLPADELWVHHSVTQPTGDLVRDMRTLERIGVARFGRFSYSYAADPQGRAAEGAGLTVGAHTKGRNSHALAVVAIGNYETTDPTDRLLDGIAQLTVHLLAVGALKPGAYPTGGHRDAPGAATACPGARLYKRLPDIRARVDALLADPPTPGDDPMARYPIDIPAGPPRPDGLVPLWRLTGPDGGVQALNGAPFYGSAPSIGVTRDDVTGIVAREDRHGYTLTTPDVWQDPATGEWLTATYSFPTA